MEERGTHSATLADLLPRAAEMYGEMPAIRFKQGEEWVARSFHEVEETVRPLAAPRLGPMRRRADMYSRHDLHRYGRLQPWQSQQG